MDLHQYHGFICGIKTAQNLEAIKQDYAKYIEARKQRTYIPYLFEYTPKSQNIISQIPRYILLHAIQAPSQPSNLFLQLILLLYRIGQLPKKFSKGHLCVYSKSYQFSVKDLISSRQILGENQFVELAFYFSNECYDEKGVSVMETLANIIRVPMQLIQAPKKLIRQVTNYLPYPGNYFLKSQFKQTNSMAQRNKKFESFRKKIFYEWKVPIIVQKHHRSGLPDIGNKIFLYQFYGRFLDFKQIIINKILSLKNFSSNARQLKVTIFNTYNFGSIYFWVGGRIISENDSMIEIYKKYANQDGFLYITYLEQETF